MIPKIASTRVGLISPTDMKHRLIMAARGKGAPITLESKNWRAPPANPTIEQTLSRIIIGSSASFLSCFGLYLIFGDMGLMIGLGLVGPIGILASIL